MTEPWEYFVTKKALNKHGLPKGKFDPFSSWQNRYDIYFMNIRFKKKKSSQNTLKSGGVLKVSSSPKGKNIKLDIEYSADLFQDTTKISAICKKNELSSPVSWEELFTNKSKAGRKLVTHTRKGVVKNDRIFLDGKEPSKTTNLGLYTADWCLFDAIQRLASKKNKKKYTFNLLEEFSMVREKQYLFHKGSTTIANDFGSCKADIYCHYGE